jgi:hypothetical protein
MVVDPGSVFNLAGGPWCGSLGKEAVKQGRQPSQTKREKLLNVSGVGKGSETASHDVKLPCAFEKLNGECHEGCFETPCVTESEVPGLLGLTSLIGNRGILDFNTLQLHFCGPGDYDLLPTLPPGTDSYQLRQAPSGHLLLPCGHFNKLDKQKAAGKLTLASRDADRSLYAEPARSSRDDSPSRKSFKALCKSEGQDLDRLGCDPQ